MKLISWNLNGLRGAHKNGLFLPIFEQKPDILCLQETKVTWEQLPEDLKNVKGYYAYFDHSKGRKGYSGTAIYTKMKPEKVEYGMGTEEFDSEGRLVVAYFAETKDLKKFVLINGYFPNGGSGPDRFKYKMDFYDAFLKFIDTLKKKGYGVIFCGDINTAHEAIDLARPKQNEENTGFLPEERAWIDKVIIHGYTDTFRYIHPTKIGAYSYWDQKTNSRDRNVGWRIDYFFVSTDILSKVKYSNMLDTIYGSDHCPIALELKK